MAISLSRFKEAGARHAEGKRLAEEYAKQQAKAKKRKGWSSLLGKASGALLTAGALGATALTGGLAAPLIGAAGAFAGRTLAHKATEGMGASTAGLRSQSKYGFGKEEAKTLREGLEQQMAVDPLKERGGFGKDVLSSYMSAGMKGQLGGVKGLLKGDIKLGEALTGSKDWVGGMAKGEIGGWKGFKSGIGDLFKTGKEVEEGVDPTMNYQSLEGSGMTGSEYDELVTSRQAGAVADDNFWDEVEDIDLGGETLASQGDYGVSEELGLPFVEEQDEFQWPSGSYEMKQGGLVHMAKSPTIVDYFGMQNKTLGGSNTQSLSQMLERK